MNTIDTMKEALLAFSGMPLTYTRKAQIEGLLRDAIAAEEAQTEPYDQQALETCDVCGWKAIVPGEPCLMCERNAKMLEPEQEPFGWYSVKHDEFMLNLRKTEHERLGTYTDKVCDFDKSLYTKPQPVAYLTDQELEDIGFNYLPLVPQGQFIKAFRAVLAAQKVKQ